MSIRNLSYRQILKLNSGEIAKETKSLKKEQILIAIICILYLVGTTALLVRLHPDFIYLTPINIIVTFGLVLANHRHSLVKLLIILLISGVGGFWVEMLGVSTGLVFGNYEYGEVLGPKYLETPFMIGVNWMMLIYCVGVTSSKILPASNFVVKSIAGALIMVSLDILIEPIAIIYDMWSWNPDNIVPLQNYYAWFGISFVFLSIFHLLFPTIKNKVAIVLLLIQFLFFWVLGLDL